MTQKPESAEPSEFQKFDTVMKRILSVSHKELEKREHQYQRKRAKKKRSKS